MIDRSEKLIQIFFIVVCCITSLHLVWYHGHLIKHPYPLELREGMFLVSTDALLKGKNPYELSLQPQITNVYGFAYHLFVYPFALIGKSGFFTHRLFSAACIFLSLGLLAWFLRRQRHRWSIIWGGCLAYYAAMLYPVTTTALSGPNAFGIMLMLASVAVVEAYSFSWMSLGVCAVLSLIAFYSKMYFGFSGLIIACYMFLFVDRKKGALFGLLLMVLFSSSLLLANHIFETYVSVGIFANINAANNLYTHTLKQLLTFIFFHADLVVLLITGLILGFLRKQEQRSFKISLTQLLLLVYSILVLVKLGGNEGSWMGYFFHLISPWLILVAFEVIHRGRVVKMGAMILMGICLCAHQYKWTWTKEDAQAWETIRELTKTHRHILNSPLLVGFLLDNNQSVYDCGSTKWSIEGVDRRGVFKGFLKPDVRLYEQNLFFTQEVLNDIAEERFDLMVLNPNFTQFNFGLLADHYRPIGQLRLHVPHFQTYFVTLVLIPNKSSEKNIYPLQ